MLVIYVYLGSIGSTKRNQEQKQNINKNAVVPHTFNVGVLEIFGEKAALRFQILANGLQVGYFDLFALNLVSRLLELLVCTVQIVFKLTDYGLALLQVTLVALGQTVNIAYFCDELGVFFIVFAASGRQGRLHAGLINAKNWLKQFLCICICITNDLKSEIFIKLRGK